MFSGVCIYRSRMKVRMLVGVCLLARIRKDAVDFERKRNLSNEQITCTFVDFH